MGEWKPELAAKIPRKEVSEQHESLKVGSKVEVKDDKGNPFVAMVMELTDQEVAIDANHPLAGKELVFDIELIEFV